MDSQTDFSKNINFTYHTSNSNSNNNEEHEKILNEKIKTLQRKLKAYQIMTVDQNKKLKEHDNLIIEYYNSLNKTYTELENELKLLKMQNSKLMDALNCKNCLIEEYQKMIEIGTQKFHLLDEHNSNLKAQQKERENKLKNIPNYLKDNQELNNKINQYENKIESMKDEYDKKKNTKDEYKYLKKV